MKTRTGELNAGKKGFSHHPTPSLVSDSQQTELTKLDREAYGIIFADQKDTIPPGSFKFILANRSRR